MKSIVSIHNLSKNYQLGRLQAGYLTFREILGDIALSPLRRWRKTSTPGHETLWALKNINLEILPGEIVGIVGHNGAGKSTLLKILSRITKPTRGRVLIYGRIGSLLEVGTGFHPDLTGRENVFLNGAILGMKHAEIARKFDEIVAFSEIEKFIDTPVKWYSSGMYLRLAFSVAAHLEPEILIMDEILAVGDAAFQLKCMDKMREIRGKGHTIFFVSHNMPAVIRLCKRVILLDHGTIVKDGSAQAVVNDYLSAGWRVGAEREWLNPVEAPGNEIARLRRVRVCDENGATLSSADIRRPVGIELIYEVLEAGHLLLPLIEILNEEGGHLFSSHDVGLDWSQRPRPRGTYISVVWIPGNLLAEGSLLVSASVVSHLPMTKTHAYQDKAVTFQVIDDLSAGTARGDFTGPISGLVRPLLNWTTKFVKDF